MNYCDFPECKEKSTGVSFYFSTRSLACHRHSYGWGELCELHITFLILEFGLKETGSGGNFEFGMFNKHNQRESITDPLKEYYGPF